MQIYSHVDYKDKALALCKRYNLSIATKFSDTNVYLYVADRLGFFSPKFKHPYIPDHTNISDQHVLNKIFTGYKNILDLTFGFGKDATILASKDKNIVALEKNLFTYLIGNDYLNTFPLNIKLINQDSIDYLTALKEKVPAIYLDPMRVYTGKAANTKPMAMLQMLHESAAFNSNYLHLLELAISKCSGIVVLKLHKKDEIPFFSHCRIIKGKNTNFAIYSSAQSSKKT